ncbi:MAG TPA: hypothetical protein VMV42_00710 [archaeon]|nr:hypothetical protein [archaeon]
MQTPTNVLNVGGDVAKDEIVVACSEGSFPTRPLANQRTALLVFLKKLPELQPSGLAGNRGPLLSSYHTTSVIG